MNDFLYYRQFQMMVYLFSVNCYYYDDNAAMALILTILCCKQGFIKGDIEVKTDSLVLENQ